jgi:hypothetical protein
MMVLFIIAVPFTRIKIIGIFRSGFRGPIFTVQERKGKPIARWGRKARGLPREIARPPKLCLAALP